MRVLFPRNSTWKYNTDLLPISNSRKYLKFSHPYFKQLCVADVKFVIMTSPRQKRVDSIDESLVKQGSSLADFINMEPRRIVMVISGDLSHMYQYDCTEDWYTPSTSSNLYVYYS